MIVTLFQDLSCFIKTERVQYHHCQGRKRERERKRPNEELRNKTKTSIYNVHENCSLVRIQRTTTFGVALSRFDPTMFMTMGTISSFTCKNLKTRTVFFIELEERAATLPRNIDRYHRRNVSDVHGCCSMDRPPAKHDEFPSKKKRTLAPYLTTFIRSVVIELFAIVSLLFTSNHLQTFSFDR